MNKYLFRYGFVKGKEIRYNILTTGSFKLSGPGGETSTPINIEMVVSQLIEDCDENKAHIKVCIEKAVADCDIPKENMPEVGKSFVMETDSLGNCKWVDGKAGWQGAEHSLMRFPENEIEIGDTWIQMVEDAAGSAPPFYNRYRLNGRDRKNPDLIIFSSEIYSGHPDLRESRNLGKSSFTFNLADNWLQDSEVRIKHEYMFPLPQRPDILLKGKTVLNVDMERIL